MKLDWKSYGDHGRTATGDKGRWVITPDGMWWILFLDGVSRGKFGDKRDAQSHAQDREDGVEIVAQD